MKVLAGTPKIELEKGLASTYQWFASRFDPEAEEPRALRA
jgi:hypothetical protein